MATGQESRYKRYLREVEFERQHPEVKEKRLRQGRIYGKEYYNKNKGKCYQTTYRWKKEMREVALELGNCTSCFKENDNPKFKYCSKCRAKCRGYYDKRKTNQSN